jgi:hypothetical protein
MGKLRQGQKEKHYLAFMEGRRLWPEFRVSDVKSGPPPLPQNAKVKQQADEQV